MYVSIEKRIKILRIFYENNLISAKKRFHKLKEYAAAENVFVTINTIKRIIFRYIFDGTLSVRQSLTRSISKTKITEHDLERLDRLIYKKRDMSAKLAKQKLRLGWVKIKTRFCQVVSHKNRIHRIIYSNFCLIILIIIIIF